MPIWGSRINPRGHASDIIQVVDRPSSSVIGNFFRNKVLTLAPRFPAWLWLLLFWSKKRPDSFQHYNFSSHTFEIITLAVGNFAASLIIYTAITALYLIEGRAASVVGIAVISVAITVCSVLFGNHQFISMLAT
jgi:hypothetical protein